MFTVRIEAFANGGDIPDVFTCDGDDVSPPLLWSGEPAGTKSFALIMDDPDAPAGTWNHWLLWDIPGGFHSLPQHYRGARPVHSGMNDFGNAAYGGPCPPKRNGPHRYFFRLYALDTLTLGVVEGAHRKDLEQAIKRHILGRAEYMGRFERN
jgi:Raf kinase inhibitor-like YbhB/YbcL family protein